MRATPDAVARKTAKKTAISPRNGATIPLGAHPGNTGGKKGRSGRKPDWLKQFCDNLLAKRESKQQVEAILADNKHPAFATMWKAVADRAHGKPKESMELTGKDGGPVQFWSFGKGREVRF
jgi:hypothetical protein